jgi:hypothetical protein
MQPDFRRVGHGLQHRIGPDEGFGVFDHLASILAAGCGRSPFRAWA